eukprot:4270143-Ditylum_brightwellii.AAC.1
MSRVATRPRPHTTFDDAMRTGPTNGKQALVDAFVADFESRGRNRSPHTLVRVAKSSIYLRRANTPNGGRALFFY